MEIERKFLVKKLPENLDQYPAEDIRQGYLCRKPVVRVRQQGDAFWLTYKGSGLMVREEYNMPLDQASFACLLAKCDGTPIEKTRYRIPLGDLLIELDQFRTGRPGLIMAEVEFPSVEAAERFTPPEWFGEEVTEKPEYQNANM